MTILVCYLHCYYHISISANNTQMDLVINVTNSDETIKKFVDDHKLDSKQPFHDFFSNFDFSKVTLNGESKYVNLKDVKIGDTINVTYTPDSQKYIEMYDAKQFTGVVFYVDAPNDNLLTWTKDKNTIIVNSLEQEGCGYYASKSYTYTIILK